MVGIKKEEEVFGNLHDMAQYRPAFYALAMHQLGKSKVEVDKQNLKSLHPLNVAKTQDARWESLRYRVAPPVDEATMEILEERARTGIIRNPALQDCSVRDAVLIRRWEERWVILPPRRQVCRYYRSLLESVSMMVVSTRMVPNKSKYLKSRARRNTDIAPGIEKPEFVPEKTYSFVKSIYAGKKSPQEANIIDIAGITAQSAAL
ncbi:hypothetical protein H4S08_000297 [Coemansia sp. RSA 1365]|nr:hypothetical protein H4S08_000297 [Coemansia sp. RSA 1365]